MTIRTRIAPSPTGYGHLGLLRTALYCYALAKKNNGQFIWRNEDTDQERFVPGTLEFNMKWIKEFGLNWDEGPDVGGPYAPYTQTERTDIYKEAYEKLISNGSAYRCFCTKERLDELRQIQTMSKQQTRYDGLCRNLTQEEIDKNLAENKPFTVRIKVPKDTKIEFDDIITHNHIVWNSNEVDDYIIVKSNGIPTYHLAAMYDDIIMKITYIFRGTEWLSSTPVHILIFDGLGIKPEDRPLIGHFPVILDPATPGKKFSKRNNSFRINGLVIRGYLKSAILNYIMLLGWAPKDNRELFTLEEFIQIFDLAGTQKSNPNWDAKKMDWFNGHYSRSLTLDQYTEEFINWIEKYLTTTSTEEINEVLISENIDADKVKKLINLSKKVIADKSILKSQLALVQERAISFWEALQQIEFFYNKPDNIDWSIKQLKSVQEQLQIIKSKISELMSSMDSDTSKWTHEEWEAGMRKIAEETNSKAGDIFMVLRVAVVGGPFSPPLFESLQILGKEEVLSRI
ncbi:MAG: glutamate--tRNA ligase [Candidatus Dojkabacteria bacterium]